MYRLFVSIEIPDGVKSSLARLCCDVPGARWVDPEQIHLTIRFIGEVDGHVYRDVLGALDGVHADPFPLTVRGVGHFPPRGEPRVLWAGLDKSPGLATLHGRIESVLTRVGLEPERRKFAPHITLAKLRNSPARAVASFIATHGLFRSEPFLVDEFFLMRSTLGAKQALHTTEATYSLRDGRGFDLEEVP